jgi:endoglucanase
MAAVNRPAALRPRLRSAGLACVAGLTAAVLAGPGAAAGAVPGAARPPSRGHRAEVPQSAPAPPRPARPQIRVNQVGYPARGPKLAFAMLPRRVAELRFTVWRGRDPVFRSRSARDLGRWNRRYQAVYLLDFSGLRAPGRYRISVAGAVAASSPEFSVAAPARLYGRLVRNGVRYFRSERDGPDVDRSVLRRRPANLTDRRAWVYRAPRYDSNDNLLGRFHRTGGPVNAEGGWFDAAGGYEKFAYTSSFADGLLLLAARDAGRRYRQLGPEAWFGLRWLTRLWHPAQRVLYIQVGIGTGNASGTIHGDYDFWFLPQAEDRLDVRPGRHPGPSAYYVKYRPVFRAAPPGHLISPAFAGRFAADFALGAQLAGRHDAARAARLLALARGVYAMARTSRVGQLVTTYPHDFYPGTEWRSAMLWGAAEVALADEALGSPRARLRHDLSVAARWARAYIAQGHPAGGDTFNLYDNGAVGEAELLRALRGARSAPAIDPGILRSDLAAQLRAGQRAAARDPFRLGFPLGQGDATPHAFGLYITNALYRQYGGSAAYQAFASQQLGFGLGANGWGSSFVVGAGSTFPHCLQSEIANLAGSLTGRGQIQLGATVDGPSNPANFSGLGTVSGMRRCAVRGFAPFDTRAAAYQDRVVSWPSVEPASDYSALSLLAFTLAAARPR